MTGFDGRYYYLTAHACMCERAHSQGGAGSVKKGYGVLCEPRAVRFKFIEEHRSAFSIELMCRVMAVSPRGLRAYRSRPASRRQRYDLVTLAHIKEQSRLSLGSYGRPRMTEELKEIGLDVGHRRVGRLMRQNGISVVRTRKHKVTTIARQAIATQSAERGIAITNSTSRRTCWVATSTLMHQTKSGPVTSAISGRAKAGCILPSSWTCIHGASLAGRSAIA